jgi:hypothetical protein
MDARGVLLRLSRCFPLVLSFLVAAALLAPGLGVSAAPRASAGISVAGQAGPAGTAGLAATVHVDAELPAAVAVEESAAVPATVVAAAPRTPHDTGVRAPAAPRGPPHHSA